VLIRKSTGEILKHAPYPREDMQPVTGLDPDLEWLIKHEPFVAPDYDSRIYELIITEEITQEPHPEHPELNQYKRTYSTQRRTDEDIILQIENAETEANEQRVGYKNRTKLVMLALGVLIRRLDNLQTTNKEKAILDMALANAVDIWKNDDEVRAKKQQLAQGLEPEIDAGWVKG